MPGMNLKLSFKHMRPLWIVAMVCSVMLISIWAILTSYLNSDAVRGKLIDRINSAIAGEVDIAAHQVSLLFGRVSLTNVGLKDQQGRPVAECAHLRAVLYWPALIWREIRVTSLGFSGLDLKLHYDGQDQLTLLQALVGETGSTEAENGRMSWQVRVDALRLRDGRIDYHRPRAGHQVSAESIDLSGSMNLLERFGHAQLSVGRVAAKFGDRQLVWEQVFLTASHHPNRAKPISLELRLPDADLQINGRVDWRAAVPDLDLDYAFNLKLASMHPWLPQDLEIKGQASGQGAVRGSLDDPAGELNLRMRDAQVDGVPIDRLTANLTLNRRRVTVAAAQTHSAWGRLDLSGSFDFQAMFADSWRQPTGGLDKLAYDLALTGRDLQPDKWPSGELDWAGRWQADLTASGSGLFGASASGKATVDLTTQGFHPPRATAAQNGQATARLTWVGRALTIQSLAADLGRHTLKANGGIDFNNRQIHGAGELVSSGISQLGDLFGINLPTGQGELKMTWQGPWINPLIKANLLANELAIEGWRLGRLLAVAESDSKGRIRFTRLMLENQGSLLEGQGSLTLRNPKGDWHVDPPVSLALSIEQLDPHDFRSLGPWRGQFNGSLDLGGSIRQPVARLDVESSKVGWQTLSGLVHGTASWRDGHLKIPSLNLTLGQSSVQMEGAIRWKDPLHSDWTADPFVAARILNSDIRLEDLHTDYAGRLIAEADLDGRFSDLQGRYRLKFHDITSDVQNLSALDLIGRFSNRRLDLDALTVLVATGQALSGSGWYGYNGDYEFSLSGADIELRHINALQRAYPVEGRMAVRMQGQGAVKKPNIKAEIEVADPTIKTRKWDDFRVAFTIQDHVVDLDANLNFMLKAHGRLDSGDFGIEAQFDETDLTPYLAVWMGDQWAGRLSGDLQASGNWNDPDRLEAKASITTADLDYQAISLLSANPFNLSLQDGIIDLPGSRFKIMEDGYLEIRASGELATDLNITADGRLPLTALAPFTDMLADAQGELTIQAGVTGPLSAVKWRADLNLDQIGFAIPALAQTIQDLNGHLIVSSQEAIVESLDGSLDGGKFSLDGRLGLDQLKPVRGELLLRARKLPLQWPGVMDTVVSGDLKLAGAPQKALLSGHLDLVEGTYYKDLRLNLWSAVSQPKRGESVIKGKAPEPWMEAVNLSVSLGYRNPFLVDNNLASLQVIPDLKVSGTLARPILSGRAEVTDGEIIFRGKSFAVKTGVVDFVNPYKIEPTLDVVSQARIRQWLVSLSLSGTPDRLAFKLSSDPPETDNDILSLILFGRTQTEFAGGDTSGSQSTAQMLAALVATAWGDDLKKTTGVDILELDTGNTGSSDDPERIQVTVGKNLSRRLTIKYAVETADGEMIQRAISEYRFLEQLLASGYQDSKGEYGGELVFRIEF